MGEAQIRALNSSIAAGYELMPFDPASHVYLEPPYIFGAASLYGCHSERRDVLDLGCGTGSLLAAAAGAMDGRVVGVDLSPSACEEARRRCAPHGERAQIIQADFLDLSPEDLGQFDLIYLLGTIYVVPDPVRDHLLALASACLKPGGVAVVGYYSGLRHAAKAHIYRILRGLVPPGLPAAEATFQTRSLLDQLAGQVSDTAAAAIGQARSLTDVELYHEALNPSFAPVLTLDLEARMARSDIQFLNLVTANSGGRKPTSHQRAAEVELQDLADGTYRRALFGRHPEGQGDCSLFASGAVWRCDLARVSAAADYQSPATYRHPESSFDVVIHEPIVQALIDEMIALARPLPSLAVAARSRLERAGLSRLVLDQSAMESLLGEMWDYRLIIPLA